MSGFTKNDGYEQGVDDGKSFVAGQVVAIEFPEEDRSVRVTALRQKRTSGGEIGRDLIATSSEECLVVVNIVAFRIVVHFDEVVFGIGEADGIPSVISHVVG